MRLRDEIGNMAAALRIHGGRIDIAARLYPSAPRPWIDLSTGINPIAWPVPNIALARYQRLPLAEEIAQLTAAAAEAYGLPANAAIVPVPGSEIAIRLLPRMIGAGRVGILTPTYGSHAAAWHDAGAEVHELAALPDPKSHDLETLVVVNPNNPDGRTIARAELATFAQAWTATGRRLIVDEAFADVRADVSLLALPELPAGVVVLRSLGKFFGLAGLRVGFVVAAEPDISTWRRLLGDWPVSGPACEIATLALRDAAWIAATRTRLSGRSPPARRSPRPRRPAAAWRHRPVRPVRSRSDEVDLLDHFARSGILIRGYAAAPRQYRFGLPADEAAWQRLAAACGALQV